MKTVECMCVYVCSLLFRVVFGTIVETFSIQILMWNLLFKIVIFNRLAHIMVFMWSAMLEF